MIAVGDFSYEGFNLLQYFVFVVACLVMLIIMMNLLISLVGDTFDRV